MGRERSRLGAMANLQINVKSSMVQEKLRRVFVLSCAQKEQVPNDCWETPTYSSSSTKHSYVQINSYVSVFFVLFRTYLFALAKS